MSLYGAFDKTKHLDELDDPLFTQEGVLTPAARRLRVLANLGISATGSELDNGADVSARMIAGGAATTLTQILHDSKTVLWDTAAGTILTLPAATGTGMRLRCVVSVTVTSNDHTLVCVGTDEFNGHCIQTDTDTTDTLASYPALAGDNFDVITLNGTTSGGLIGDWFEVEDIVTGVWAVRGQINSTGTVVTPFSTT